MKIIPNFEVGILAFALCVALIQSCKQDDIIGMNASKCYEGTIVGEACPSYAFVQVTNASIGKRWESADTAYENVIAITNYPDSLSPNPDKRIYFTIDVQATKTGANCAEAYPCPAVLIGPSIPEVLICAKELSNLNCN